MSILDQIISELETKNHVEQIRELCAKIDSQEKMEHPDKAPFGANVFLTIEVPPRRKHEISYLMLEREDEDTYLAVYTTMLSKYYREKDAYPKRVKVWQIKDFKPKKVLTKFARITKMLRGE